MQDYSAFKDVIAICRDAEQGYRSAANAVRTPALRDLFEEYSAQRAGFARELHRLSRTMGMHIDDPSGLAGALLGGWIELKGILSRHNEHQILIEAARGEEQSVKTYRQTLAMNLSAEMRTLIESQAAQVQQARDRIVALRDSTARRQQPTEHKGGVPR